MAKESPLQISAIDLFVKGADHVVEILHKAGVNFLIFGQERSVTKMKIILFDS